MVVGFITGDSSGLWRSSTTTYGTSMRGAGVVHCITSAVPAITRCSCSTSSVIWNAASYDQATSIVPRTGAWCWSRWSPATASGAKPEVYELLEHEGIRYVIRLPANQVLQRRIGHLLTRPRGRPPKEPIEWHQGELYPRVGFIVTSLSRPAQRVVKFYNGRGTAEQHIKEGKNAIRWTRLSCHAFRHNAVRLQLHALAYNLANFMRTLALPEEVEHWSLTTLREKLVKIGARIVRHGRYVVFQLAEVAVLRALFAGILCRIDQLRPKPPPLAA